ncbi:MAG TPA: molybdopterin cofactor-binding domain-containing protein [Blastocatellia bacterium]|nr:molybdopterin cofactor-binding domain-containing protein [Blastocatellia bacterium]
MIERLKDEIELEPERYELTAGPAYQFELGEMQRRGFFKVLGGGVLIVLALKDALAQQESGGGGRRGGGPRPVEIGAWLHIAENGTVTAYTGKAEVGQNIRTSLTQAVAEELRSPVSAIKIVMGDTDLTPFDAGTFGSRTTPDMFPQICKAAAAAREVMLDLAAEQLKVERGALLAESGKITHPMTKQALSYGQLSKGQKIMKAIGATPLALSKDWKVAGKPATKINGRDIVTGKHQYTPDIKLPGMLHGRVLRPSAFGATLASPASIDAKEAEKLSGVTVVRDGDFVGVTAPSEETATRAVASIRAEWKTTPQVSAKELFAHLKKTPNPPADAPAALSESLAAAHQKLERTYTIAYIAHAPLEPRAAVAEWKDGKLTVWTGTQRPFGVRSELASAFRIPETSVRVIVPDTGSGYGGKHSGEQAIEAARLAKAAGKPVKLVWTREEEFTWAYFRPSGVIDVTSGVSKDGVITAWDFHNYNSGNAGLRPVYAIQNQRNEFHRSDSPLRQGSYRALASTANHFAREVHIDELATSLKMDPLEFRLKNLKDARLRAVLEAAAKAFGWGKSKPAANHGFGIAGGFEKAGYVANCAEVAVDRASGKVKLVRVVTAFECGAIVNPDGLKNQVEGSVIQGIGGALFEAIDFEDGKILNPRFSRYRVPRFSDMPKLETVLLDRKDLQSAGAGECPIVALAPAVGAAIFDATGVRLRALPMVPSGLKA